MVKNRPPSKTDAGGLCQRAHPRIRFSTVAFAIVGGIRQAPTSTTGNRVIDTEDTGYVLAIESGGSGTRVALARASDGAIVHLERCESGSCLYRDPAVFSEALGLALARVLAAAPAEQGAIVAAGMAGPMDEALVTPLLARALPETPRRVYSEGDIARGLYGIQTGVALIAGTGCSCSAVDEAGTLISLGGYGPQFGDEGSAYWIGCAGLKAAFLAEQGRIEPTALLDAVRTFYEIQSPWDMHREAGGSGHVPAPRIAAFAGEVDRVARDFDRTAMQILEEAGAHLGQLILDTAERARLTVEPIPLVMTGGALRSERVVAAIERKLSTNPLLFSHHPIAHEPIHGLIRLLQQSNEVRTLEDVS